ncbi:MAG: hypothetical protein IJ661_12670 [Lachnospiraceae bacterium]|nr:hypothetical protein [Lachnospiraceae bacterium]
MTRTFKEMESFTKKWLESGLDDNDLATLQEMLLKNPKKKLLAKLVERLKEV